ncbi:TlpA family protein disulfide reductase [Aquimarina sp. W85]|uniref:TlpA family protein disulfide reductase n=1 Tax=Aquimarina rhodophyticola TaxID=3342246 RepID=UPI00366CC8A9
MKINKKNLSNLLFVLVLVLFLIPYTRGLLQIYLTRFFSFSPSVIEQKDQEHVISYDWVLEGVNTDNLDFNTCNGKVVIVNFWATWCPPCIAEMPSLQNLYISYKDRVTFLFVTNEEDAVLDKFMRSKGYDFPIYRSTTSLPVPLDASSLPTTYLIDRDGSIMINKTGAADWNTKQVRKLLDDLILK